MHVAAEISALDGFCDKDQQQQELGILVVGYMTDIRLNKLASLGATLVRNYD